MKKNAAEATVATAVVMSGRARGAKVEKSEGLRFWGAERSGSEDGEDDEALIDDDLNGDDGDATGILKEETGLGNDGR